MSYARTTFARDGFALALHTWSAAAPHTVVVYIHGTQSHAGWLFETGPALARLGCVVYALDRRGSGESEGPRGHAESFRPWIDDYIAVMQHARARHPSLPLLLDGQSFGGAIAVAVAGDPRAIHDAAVLVTPLIVPRVGFDLWKDVADDVPVRLPAPDEWFTTQPRYLEFIRDDKLMNRAVTRRFQQARLELAQHYMALPAPLAGRPAALVVPRKDPMIDVASARDVFARLSGDTGIVVELPATDHYLDFTPAQEQLWRFKASFARSVA
jgi:alpha-beta hydrolase superfamily lysophospholipase